MSNENQILFFSDLHIHAHKKSRDRLKDCLRVLEWVLETAIDRKIHDVIFLGDLFHDRSRIEILTLHRVFQIFERFFHSGSKLRLHLLLGNHDLWNRENRDIHSPVFLRALPGIDVIDRPMTKIIQELPISFLPFTEDPVHDLSVLRKDQARMLCGHVAVNGALLNSFGTESEVIIERDGEMIPLDPEMFSPWEKVLLGHYHKSQKLGNNNNVEYIGSPLELSFAETDQQKHIAILDTSAMVMTYLSNRFSPRHLIIDHDRINDYDLNEQFVIVKVPSISSTDIVDLRREILSKFKVGSLEFRAIKEKDRNKDDLIIKEARGLLEKREDVLARYISENIDGFPGLDRGHLLKIGLEICSKSEEIEPNGTL